jgi:hypothetical protein
VRNYVDYFGSFLAALELWKYVKGYDPRHEGPRNEVPQKGTEGVKEFEIRNPK